MLDELIPNLWDLQMHGMFVLHVFHVAGTRMIESGIDGLSCGKMVGGIAKGMSMREFVPIYKSPIERSPSLKDWVTSWWPVEIGELTYMTPENWFDKNMDTGCFLWDLPPAAGGVAIEQLCTHIHGVPKSLHVVLVPWLCTWLFRKQLGKVVDLLLTVETNHTFWNKTMHEPLLLGLYLPLLPPLSRFAPQKLKHTQLVERVQSKLYSMQKEGHKVEWHHLRKLLFQAWKIPTMPHGMAQRLLCT